MSSADNDMCSRIKVVPSVSPFEVPTELHRLNRTRLCQALKEAGVSANSVVFLAGGVPDMRHETDHEEVFRQESFFHWATGVKEPDFFVSIHIGTGKTTLFIPRLPESYAVWMGPIKTCEDYLKIYDVEAVKFNDEIASVVVTSSLDSVLVLEGTNTDSGAVAKPGSFVGIEACKVDKTTLWPIIVELRTVKTSYELDVLRYISKVSSDGHIAALQTARAGMREYQIESTFRHWCYYHGGARHMSYTCICAAGISGAVLHYGHAGEPNSRVVKAEEMFLLDMGGEFHCYGADISSSFPVNGTFTEDQRAVYSAVLSAVYAVESEMRAGVHWADMHALAYRHILTGLVAAGILQGSVDAMMDPAVNLGAVFMPHGLGHFLGIDTHDVGGYNDGSERSALAGFKSLRCGRVLRAGNFITVEPGVYFIDPLLDEALANPLRSPFIVKDVLQRFRGFGGVRIEDNVLVTDDGCENFTFAPRTIEDIEKTMRGEITSIEQITKFK